MSKDWARPYSKITKQTQRCQWAQQNLEPSTLKIPLASFQVDVSFLPPWVTEPVLLVQKEVLPCPLEGCLGRWSLRGCSPFSASRPCPSSNGLSAFEPFPLALPAPRESRAHQDHETRQSSISFHVLNIWLSPNCLLQFSFLNQTLYSLVVATMPSFLCRHKALPGQWVRWKYVRGYFSEGFHLGTKPLCSPQVISNNWVYETSTCSACSAFHISHGTCLKMHIVLVFILHHLTLGQLRHTAPCDSVTMQVSHKRRWQQCYHMIGSSGQAMVHDVPLAEMMSCSIQLCF